MAELLHLPDGKEVHDIIALGGFALVLEWSDDTVLKVPRGRGLEREMIETEARIYQRLCREKQHPYILRYVERLDEGIVLGLASRGTLQSYLNQRPGKEGPPLKQRLKWARHLAEAFEFVHSFDVLQIDIGCHNVFLDGDLNVLLGDFRSASIDGSTSKGAYGDGYDHPTISIPCIATEIFAFGSLLLELMTGKRPPVGISKGIFPSVIHLPALSSVILKCWNGEYNSMKEVVHDISSEGSPPALIPLRCCARQYLMQLYQKPSTQSLDV